MSQPLADGLRPVKHDKPLWTDQDLKLIAFDLATKYLVDKSAGKPTPLTQLVHEKLMEMRDALAAELLTIAYGKGYSDAQAKMQRLVDGMEEDFGETHAALEVALAQLAACNKSLAGHVWAYNVPDDDIGDDENE